MGQDYKDYVSANGGIEGQVTPVLQNSAGVNQIIATTAVTAQFSTQTNPGQPPHYGINSVTQAQQNLAVAANQSRPGSRNFV
jgi:hypothetical protein